MEEEQGVPHEHETPTHQSNSARRLASIVDSILDQDGHLQGMMMIHHALHGGALLISRYATNETRALIELDYSAAPVGTTTSFTMVATYRYTRNRI